VKKSHNLWLTAWYGKSAWIYLLLPLSWLFGALSALRKFVVVNFLQQKISVPVVVVGNISVGGTGKTPLIIALIKYLQAQGYKPGVVSRGYGGKAPYYPYLLNETSRAADVGDEPLLIYRSGKCAVCVAPDRVAAAKKLVEAGCTIILSDDGMQHYALGRNMEIAVVDGQRLFGNQQLLPVGPLREPVSRLKSVDLIVVNNPASTHFLSEYHSVHSMTVQPLGWRAIMSWQEYDLNSISFNSPIHAVAGIGNPERFYKSLESLSLVFFAHSFPDHHAFSAQNFEGYGTVIMTEKDAVKCQDFAMPEWYALIVGANLTDDFWKLFQYKLDSL
jgi:tetraacyldisaccharide 4'-kinase